MNFYAQTVQCPVQITGPFICNTTDLVVLQQESTNCASIYQWNRNNYPYLPTSADDPIVIRLNIIFVQDPSGGSNFQQNNTEQDAMIDDMMGVLNDLYSNMSPPNDWSLCRNINYDYGVIPDLKIQFVCEKIYLPFQDWSNHDKSICPNNVNNLWYMALDNAVAALPNYKPGINVYCTTNMNVQNELIINQTTTAHNTTGISCSQYPTYSNYDRTSRIHMPDYYTKWWWMKNIVPTDQSVNPNLNPYNPTVRSWDFTTKGHALAHEIGHSLELYHHCVHYGVNQCPESLMNQSYQSSHSYLPATEVGNMYRAIQLSNVRKFVLGDCYNSNPLVLTQNTIWDFDVKFFRDIIVENGATLTISCNLYMTRESKIIVKSGGKLIIDGGKISADDRSISWLGIEVQGNANLPQYPITNQGVVEIINDGTIENAKIGIYAYQDITIPLFGSSITYSLGGGIIRANNASFINNEVDIKMAPYRYLNSYNQKPVNQASYITRSNFETNNDLFTTTADITHISLLGVHGLFIRGNTFTNTNTSLLTTQKGIAINSTISSISVIPYCDPQNPTCVDEPNEFSNLYYGIKCYEQSGSSNLIVINDNNFVDIYKSIYLSGTNGTKITLNNIKSADFFPTQSGQPSPGVPYGIYLNGGKGFRIEENHIYRPASNGAAVSNGSRGIIVNNTGAEDNQIYRNKLNNLFLSEQAQGFNSGKGSKADKGLKFFCNISETDASSYDFYVFGNYYLHNWSLHRSGIATTQMQSIINSNGISVDAPSGNTYSNSHQNISLPLDYDNAQGQIIDYYWGNITNYAGRVEPLKYANINPHPMQGEYDACPSKNSTGGNGNTQTELYAKLNLAQIAYNSSKVILNIWKDGGNANLDEEVETTQPWDLYQEFNSLLAESPYLSEEVLIEVINNPSFTSLMVKLLMLANPHGKESFEVMEALENRLPAMPQTYIDEIKNQVSSSSQLKVLEGNVAADYHLISNIGEDIKRMYRADNTNAYAKDSLIAFTSRQPDIYDKFELASIYLSYGQYDDMQNVLSDIPCNYEMDDEKTAELIEFTTAINIAKNMHENNLYEEGLSESNRTNLETILNADKPMTSQMALALLKRDNPDYVFNEIVNDVSQNSARMANPKTNNTLVMQNDEYKLYPNPAIDYTTLKYNCKYENLNYTISDMQGKVLKNKSLKTISDIASNEVLINLGDLSSGSYQIIIKSNGLTLWSEKMIITE